MARCRIILAPRSLLAVAAVLAASILVGWTPVPAPGGQEPEAALQVDAPPCYATVTTAPPDLGARILSNRDPERVTMSSDDIVDVEVGDLSVAAGDRLEIFRILGPVERPDGGELGQAVLVLGELTVEDVAAGRVVGRIGEVCAEVEVGDRLRPGVELDRLAAVPKPEFRPDRALTPRPGDATVVFGHVETVPGEGGELGDSFAQIAYGPGEVVTVDQGSADGWSAGEVVVLYQDRPLYADPPGYEEGSVVLLGTGVVISVQRDTSALLLTGGDRAVRIGARARRRTAEQG